MGQAIFPIFVLAIKAKQVTASHLSDIEDTSSPVPPILQAEFRLLPKKPRGIFSVMIWNFI